MQYLSNDVCRCHNEACQKRDSCRRFLDRNKANREEFDLVTWSEDCSAGKERCPLYMKA